MNKNSTFPVPTKFLSSVSLYNPKRKLSSDIIRLDGNEGPTPDIDISKIIPNMDVQLINSYPDTKPLQNLLAERFQINSSQLIITAGGDDAIERALRASVDPGSEVMLPSPTFEMIPKWVKLLGGKIKEYQWKTPPFPLNKILNNITRKTKAIVIVTPNNPTGFVAKAADVVSICQAAPHSLVIVDNVYGDFDHEPIFSATISMPNAVHIGSFSKAWGMAGLRLGWAAGNEKLICWLKTSGHPYPVSSISVYIASMILLGSLNYMKKYIKRTKRYNKILSRLIILLGGEPLPTSANFVSAYWPDPEWIKNSLLSMGISIRGFESNTDLKKVLRITTPPTPTIMKTLISSVKTIAKPEALFFDMDNTLVDVTSSYHEAIKKTCSFFGIDVKNEDIREAKLSSDANNDWVLSHKLIKSKGINVDFETIKNIFERFYHGTDTESGLKNNEHLTIPGKFIEKLSYYFKLGLVTGRPEKDAKEQLEKFRIKKYFKVIVTLDDVPPKPDPAGIKLAKKILDISYAWYVGDTPDDIVAARRAKALPIGVLPPAGGEKERKALKFAGAATVLDRLEYLEDLLWKSTKKYE